MPLSSISNTFYQVNATAQDCTNLTDIALVNISIVNTNDYPPVFNSSLYRQLVTNTLPIGSSVIQVMATDKDLNQFGKVSYSILNQTNLFAIHSATGIISTASSLRLIVENITLTILAQDGGSPPFNTTALVDLDIYNPCQDVSLWILPPYNTTLDPSVSSVGSLVIAINGSVQDPRQNQAVDEIIMFYQIMAGNNDGLFEINGQTGIVRLAKDLQQSDFGKTRTLTISLSNNGSCSVPITTSDVSININYEITTSKNFASSVQLAFSSPETSILDSTVSSVKHSSFNILSPELSLQFTPTSISFDIALASSTTLQELLSSTPIFYSSGNSMIYSSDDSLLSETSFQVSSTSIASSTLEIEAIPSSQKISSLPLASNALESNLLSSDQDLVSSFSKAISSSFIANIVSSVSSNELNDVSLSVEISSKNLEADESGTFAPASVIDDSSLSLQELSSSLPTLGSSSLRLSLEISTLQSEIKYSISSSLLQLVSVTVYNSLQPDIPQSESINMNSSTDELNLSMLKTSEYHPLSDVQSDLFASEITHSVKPENVYNISKSSQIFQESTQLLDISASAVVGEDTSGISDLKLSRIISSSLDFSTFKPENKSSFADQVIQPVSTSAYNLLQSEYLQSGPNIVSSSNELDLSIIQYSESFQLNSRSQSDLFVSDNTSSVVTSYFYSISNISTTVEESSQQLDVSASTAVGESIGSTSDLDISSKISSSSVFSVFTSQIESSTDQIIQPVNKTVYNPTQSSITSSIGELDQSVLNSEYILLSDILSYPLTSNIAIDITSSIAIDNLSSISNSSQLVEESSQQLDVSASTAVGESIGSTSDLDISSKISSSPVFSVFTSQIESSTDQIIQPVNTTDYNPTQSSITSLIGELDQSVVKESSQQLDVLASTAVGESIGSTSDLDISNKISSSSVFSVFTSQIESSTDQIIQPVNTTDYNPTQSSITSSIGELDQSVLNSEYIPLSDILSYPLTSNIAIDITSSIAIDNLSSISNSSQLVEESSQQLDVSASTAMGESIGSTSDLDISSKISSSSSVFSTFITEIESSIDQIIQPVNTTDYNPTQSSITSLIGELDQSVLNSEYILLSDILSYPLTSNIAIDITSSIAIDNLSSISNSSQLVEESSQQLDVSASTAMGESIGSTSDLDISIKISSSSVFSVFTSQIESSTDQVIPSMSTHTNNLLQSNSFQGGSNIISLTDDLSIQNSGNFLFDSLTIDRTYSILIDNSYDISNSSQILKESSHSLDISASTVVIESIGGTSDLDVAINNSSPSEISTFKPQIHSSAIDQVILPVSTTIYSLLQSNSLQGGSNIVSSHYELNPSMLVSLENVPLSDTQSDLLVSDITFPLVTNNSYSTSRINSSQVFQESSQIFDRSTSTVVGEKNNGSSSDLNVAVYNSSSLDISTFKPQIKSSTAYQITLPVATTTTIITNYNSLQSDRSQHESSIVSITQDLHPSTLPNYSQLSDTQTNLYYNSLQSDRPQTEFNVVNITEDIHSSTLPNNFQLSDTQTNLYYNSLQSDRSQSESNIVSITEDLHSSTLPSLNYFQVSNTQTDLYYNSLQTEKSQSESNTISTAADHYPSMLPNSDYFQLVDTQTDSYVSNMEYSFKTSHLYSISKSNQILQESSQSFGSSMTIVLGESIGRTSDLSRAIYKSSSPEVSTFKQQIKSSTMDQFISLVTITQTVKATYKTLQSDILQSTFDIISSTDELNPSISPSSGNYQLLVSDAQSNLFSIDIQHSLVTNSFYSKSDSIQTFRESRPSFNVSTSSVMEVSTGTTSDSDLATSNSLSSEISTSKPQIKSSTTDQIILPATTTTYSVMQLNSLQGGSNIISSADELYASILLNSDNFQVSDIQSDLQVGRITHSLLTSYFHSTNKNNQIVQESSQSFNISASSVMEESIGSTSDLDIATNKSSSSDISTSKPQIKSSSTDQIILPATTTTYNVMQSNSLRDEFNIISSADEFNQSILQNSENFQLSDIQSNLQVSSITHSLLTSHFYSTNKDNQIVQESRQSLSITASSVMGENVGSTSGLAINNSSSSGISTFKSYLKSSNIDQDTPPATMTTYNSLQSDIVNSTDNLDLSRLADSSNFHLSDTLSRLYVSSIAQSSVIRNSDRIGNSDQIFRESIQSFDFLTTSVVIENIGWTSNLGVVMNNSSPKVSTFKQTFKSFTTDQVLPPAITTIYNSWQSDIIKSTDSLGSLILTNSNNFQLSDTQSSLYLSNMVQSVTSDFHSIRNSIHIFTESGQSFGISASSVMGESIGSSTDLDIAVNNSSPSGISTFKQHMKSSIDQVIPSTVTAAYNLLQSNIVNSIIDNLDPLFNSNNFQLSSTQSSFYVNNMVQSSVTSNFYSISNNDLISSESIYSLDISTSPVMRKSIVRTSNLDITNYNSSSPEISTFKPHIKSSTDQVIPLATTTIYNARQTNSLQGGLNIISSVDESNPSILSNSKHFQSSYTQSDLYISNVVHSPVTNNLYSINSSKSIFRESILSFDISTSSVMRENIGSTSDLTINNSSSSEISTSKVLIKSSATDQIISTATTTTYNVAQSDNLQNGSNIVSSIYELNPSISPNSDNIQLSDTLSYLQRLAISLVQTRIIQQFKSLINHLIFGSSLIGENIGITSNLTTKNSSLRISTFKT
ncbi:uncharacterized protein TRIADDRAFT_57050 [Trichoplax adhaerens]|uniref:Cadherin domain-containing protein n=1 Tax=Trichoplax adhaerens TaxID=10228 RepID=B3S0H5_TRIAD|nr:hypothetical protein TRIADDRAFT_57050 [Trichoplax adhaerens]EDV23643.1 hypothetical protein TRIADDRAFT_57050 [Trichoplax adhaerens]|eukprot:XP_002113169.1 hypothetical protein TRIADDRAFT_57050 [Trichoplax adhaerens]